MRHAEEYGGDEEQPHVRDESNESQAGSVEDEGDLEERPLVYSAGEGRWLVPVALVFAASLAWRDSPTVVLLNLLAFLVAVSLAALWGRSGRLRLAGVSEYVLGGI